MEKKPKFFFAGHNREVEKYFEDISNNIFSIADSILCHKKEETHKDEFELFSLIRSCNGIFFVVSNRFLSEASLSRDSELPFALKNRIPVLPILIEEVDQKLYEEYFSTIQYIKYSDKEKDYVRFMHNLYTFVENNKEVSSNDIKNAFNKIVFASYRKIDIEYLKDLFNKIHGDRRFLSVGYWFDAFLTVGEKYDNEINDIISSFDDFILVITNNVLKENNYVVEFEYPFALEHSKNIIPVLMEDVDENQLHKVFKDLPEPLKITNESFLDELFLRLKLKDKPLSKLQRHLIAIAYQNGSWVEQNEELAFKLFEELSNENYPKTNLYLSNYYLRKRTREGYEKAQGYINKTLDRKLYDKDEFSTYVEALKHALAINGQLGNDEERLRLINVALDSPLFLNYESKKYILYDLASYNIKHNKFDDAEKIFERLKGKINEDSDQDFIYAIRTLELLLLNHHNKYDKAIELGNKYLEEATKIFGVNQEHTLNITSSIVDSYFYKQDYDKALELAIRGYQLALKNPNKTLKFPFLETLSMTYNIQRKYSDALQYAKELYEERTQLYGLQDVENVLCLVNYCLCLRECNQSEKAITLLNEVLISSDQSKESVSRYFLEKEMIECLNNIGKITQAEEHIKALSSLFADVESSLNLPIIERHYFLLGLYYYRKNDFDSSIPFFIKYKESLLEEYGETPEAKAGYMWLGEAYYYSKKYKQAIPELEKYLHYQKDNITSNYLDALYNLSFSYNKEGQSKKSVELYWVTHDIAKTFKGEFDSTTINCLLSLANIYLKVLKDFEQGKHIVEYLEKHKDKLSEKALEHLSKQKQILSEIN